MAKKDNDFDLVNLPEEARDPEIKAEDFTLQQADTTIHEQKFQTKPTTFWKDSMRRFSKNKSSVVAAYILGFLVLLAVFVPIFNTSDVSKPQNVAFQNLEPKLFNSGTGFWDGVKTITHEPVDANTHMPNETYYRPSGISDLVTEGEQYTNIPTSFGKEGYVQLGLFGGTGIDKVYLTCNGSSAISGTTSSFTLNLDEYDLYISKFTVVDEAKVKEKEGSDKTYPENFKQGLVSFEFFYFDAGVEYSYTIIDPALNHSITEATKVNIGEIIKTKTGKSSFTDFRFRIKLERAATETPADHVCCLIQNLMFETTSTNEKVIQFFSDETAVNGTNGISFNDAMKFINRTSIVGSGAGQVTNPGYWNSISDKTKYARNIYLGKAVYASFKYDTYNATLGERDYTVTSENLENWKSNGWVDFDIRVVQDPLNPGTYIIDKTRWDNFAAAHDGKGIVILNSVKCPLTKEFEYEDVRYTTQAGGKRFWSADCKVMYHKILGFDTMPSYLFGTDRGGRDMFKYVFEGLRNSLALGVVTFVVCFLFGLLWGSVSGYFGGAVDMIMERFTDILSGVPWVVVMTIIILKANESSFGVFALALCLTGWIGTASRTRTQFYRFRGREYVLASRTLGASDARLIAKHILPNAMGTIITGAVLMIPSVIFSEATISYLGLGFKNLSSLGVILSDNQARLFDYPYQLIFPSVVIALIMISFNLFGNGLRDAINPSLKGEEE